MSAVSSLIPSLPSYQFSSQYLFFKFTALSQKGCAAQPAWMVITLHFTPTTFHEQHTNLQDQLSLYVPFYIYWQARIVEHKSARIGKSKSLWQQTTILIVVFFSETNSESSISYDWCSFFARSHVLPMLCVICGFQVCGYELNTVVRWVFDMESAVCSATCSTTALEPSMITGLKICALV